MQKRSYWAVSILSLLSLWGVGTLLTSCSADDEYSSMRLAFYFDNSKHQNATLASAMNSASPGVFCLISYNAQKKVFTCTSNNGQSTPSSIYADEQQQGMTSRIGMNNGIIVGYSNQNLESGNYQFYAFDAQCPNCFDYNAIPMKSYPLTLNSDGTATCANCKRKYNMNYGGLLCVNNTGNNMTKYRCSTTGALGYLVIN